MGAGENGKELRLNTRGGVDPLVLGAWGMLLLLVAAFSLYSWRDWNERIERELREVELINQLVARTTEAIFEQVSGNVRVIGDRLLELHERGDQKGIAVVMRRFTQGTPGMKRLGVLTPEGRTLYLSAGQLPRESAPPTPALTDSFVQAERHPGLYIGRTLRNPQDDWVIPLRFAVRDAAGRVRLVVAAGLSVDAGDDLLRRFRLPAAYGFRILRLDGHAQLVHPLPADRAESVYGQPLPERIRSQIRNVQPGQSGTFVDDLGLDGVPRLGAWFHLRGFDLISVVSVPREKVWAEWVPHMRFTGMIFLLFALVGYLVYRMALRTRDAIERRSAGLLRLALDSARMEIWTRDLVTGQIDLALRFGMVFDLRPEQVPQTFEQYIAMIHPEDRPRAIALAQKTLNGDEAVHDEYRVLHPDGSLRWVEIHGGPMFENGRVVGRVGTIADVTARREREEEIRRLNEELERRVLERTEELARANRDLESFSYSVAHDLRAPLRAVSGFGQILREDYAGKLEEGARSLLERIRRSAERMEAMIDGLLRLTQVSRMVLHDERVDLSAIAGGIVERLREMHPERRVEVRIVPGLLVRGDPALLETVLENLLGNAWKFTAAREDAHIELGCGEIADGRLACFVRDNGAGFDMQYMQKLFGVFQRMHSETEFPGTGVGLSIVQRIVERHGGKVWAQATQGAGASFYFTLKPAR